MSAYQYYALDPPARWQAGTTGTPGTPFYFDCADCGAHEPEIAGIISTDGTFAGIALLKGDMGAPVVKTAMFCAPCFTKRMETAPA